MTVPSAPIAESVPCAGGCPIACVSGSPSGSAQASVTAIAVSCAAASGPMSSHAGGRSAVMSRLQPAMVPSSAPAVPVAVATTSRQVPFADAPASDESAARYGSVCGAGAGNGTVRGETPSHVSRRGFGL